MEIHYKKPEKKWFFTFTDVFWIYILMNCLERKQVKWTILPMLQKGGNIGAESVLPDCQDSTPFKCLHWCTYSRKQLV